MGELKQWGWGIGEQSKEMEIISRPIHNIMVNSNTKTIWYSNTASWLLDLFKLSWRKPHIQLNIKFILTAGLIVDYRKWVLSYLYIVNQCIYCIFYNVCDLFYPNLRFIFFNFIIFIVIIENSIDSERERESVCVCGNQWLIVMDMIEIQKDYWR